jgi:ribosome-associated translation inhibitor RaiA
MVKKADSKIYSVFDERRRQLGTVEPSTVRKILTSMSGDSLPMYEARNDSMYMEILLGGLGEMYGYSERNLLLTAPNLEQHPDDRGAVTSGAILYSQQETISDSTRAFVIERLQQFEDLDADVVKRMKVSYSCEAFRTKDADTTPAYVALEKIVASPAKYRVDDIKCDVVINGQTSILETTPDNLKLFVSTLEEVIGSASDHIVMPGQP